MRIRLFILLFTISLLSSCIEHKLSSDEVDDLYFTKKDIKKIEEEEKEEIEEVTGVEEVIEE